MAENDNLGAYSLNNATCAEVAVQAHLTCNSLEHTQNTLSVGIPSHSSVLRLDLLSNCCTDVLDHSCLQAGYC